MKVELIDLKEDDFETVKEIYDYYVLNSTATFHTERVSVSELKEKILVGHPKYKSYLIKCDGLVSGYCYISQYNRRQAYDRTAEISLYLKSASRGKGIGRQAIHQLEGIAIDLGIVVILGIISGDNSQSIRLFEGCGYEKCGHLKELGVKFGRIIDVLIYQKIFVS
ncbi:MAG: N-acetyltransferase family protein [Chryseolinea sp.]